MQNQLMDLMAWIRAHQVQQNPGTQDSTQVRFPDAQVPASSGGMNPYAMPMQPPMVDYGVPALPPAYNIPAYRDYIHDSMYGDGPEKKAKK
jgi:hypothetical protein